MFEPSFFVTYFRPVCEISLMNDQVTVFLCYKFAVTGLYHMTIQLFSKPQMFVRHRRKMFSLVLYGTYLHMSL